MKKKKVFFNIFVIVIFICISIILTSKSLQNDTFYTIKVGESITKYGVDMKEHFSWISNLSYTYPHWLYDTLIYLIFSVAGFRGIYISTIVLAFVLLFTMYFTAKTLSKNSYLSFAVTSIFFYTLGWFITARAQMISYILLLLVLYSIKQLRENNNKRYYLYIFLCSLLIANTHLAVWPIIFILYLPFIVSDIFYILNKKYKFKFLENYNLIIEKSSLKKLGICILLTLITGFITPNFLVPFTYLYYQLIGGSTNFISEHLPITIKSVPFVFIFVFLFAILLWNKKTKIKLSDFFLLCGLILMSFLSYRNYSLLMILSIYSVVDILKNHLNFDLKLLFNNVTFITTIGVFFMCLTFMIIKYNSKIPYYQNGDYPVNATEYIISNLDYKNIHLYNGYEYGSYLIYKGVPVFIDSRSDLYLKEFNKDCTVFTDYLNIFKNYKDTFKKYNITHILVKNDEKINGILKISDNYKTLFHDKYYTLYEVLTN